MIRTGSAKDSKTEGYLAHESETSPRRSAPQTASTYEQKSHHLALFP